VVSLSEIVSNLNFRNFRSILLFLKARTLIKIKVNEQLVKEHKNIVDVFAKHFKPTLKHLVLLSHFHIQWRQTFRYLRCLFLQLKSTGL
jgi:hypothetical protein